MEKYTKVTYNGVNRPYLKGLTGTVQAFDNNGRTAMVNFEGPTRDYTEWVGVAYLNEKVDTAITTARKQIQEKISGLEKQISDLRSQVSKLNAANKALKDME